MDKETLAKAKELDEDIQLICNVTDYYRTHNDSPGTSHFDFCKNYSGEDYDCVHLPRWMNQKLMAVLYQERNRLQEELDALGNDSEIITDVPEADMTGGKSKPADKPHKDSWTDKVIRSMERLMSWMLYSMTFCILFGVAGLKLSTREYVAYSLMLGLVTGSINNLERIIRELFGKKED